MLTNVSHGHLGSLQRRDMRQHMMLQTHMSTSCDLSQCYAAAAVIVILMLCGTSMRQPASSES